MENVFIEKLSINPIVAAISDYRHIQEAIASGVEVIFLLSGSVFTLKDAVGMIKAQNKMVFVHFDLVEGYSKDLVGLDFLLKDVVPDGIISTRNNIIKKAKESGFYSIQRLFLLDSLNLNSGISAIKANNPDAVEILPGVMPKITKYMVGQTSKPIITGGLIRDKEDIISSLKAGASGISTSRMDLWNI
jgi:glycerol uptake operon antiterminator